MNQCDDNGSELLHALDETYMTKRVPQEDETDNIPSTSSYSVPDLLWETQGHYTRFDMNQRDDSGSELLHALDVTYMTKRVPQEDKMQCDTPQGRDGLTDEVHVDGRNASTYFEPSQPPQTTLNTRTPVPQRTYQKKQGGEPSHPNPVFFHTPDNTPINLGAVRDNLTEMSGAKEVAFPGKERQRPSIRILWPGSKYEDFEFQVHFKKGMTKEELGKNVLNVVDKFIQKNQGTTNDIPQWTVGNGFITIDNLYLVSARFVTTGTVILTLEVSFP